MRHTILGLTVLAAAASAPAFAQTDAPSELTVSANTAVVTDYRFRGVSQTDKHFALQGGIDVTHESGFYVGTWGSSVDDYVAAGSDQEIDLYLGYNHDFGGVALDVGVLYYWYPGSGGAKTDFVEPYASLSTTIGPVTGEIGIAYAPKQHALAWNNDRDDNLYTYLDLEGAIPNSPIGVAAHLGYSKGRSFLTNGRKSYLDWSVGATYTWNNLVFGVSYVDTNFRRRDDLVSPGGRQLGKAGVVGSVGVSF